MPRGDRVVVTGDNRLAWRVARQLAAREAQVIVIVDDPDAIGLDGQEDLGDVELHVRTRSGSRDHALQEVGLAEATSFVVLGEDDNENLRWALAGRAVAPDIALVLRTFHPELADRAGEALAVRRAFSSSALGAPVFVAGALGGEVLETFRLGDEEIVVAAVDVTPTSPLLARTPNQVKAETGCAVIAVATGSENWQPNPPDAPLPAGGRAVIGGLLLSVLAVARDTSRATRPAEPTAVERDELTTGTIRRTLLPLSAAAFVAIIAIGAIVYAAAFDQGPVEALHVAVTTAMGDPGPEGKSTAVTLFAIATTLAGVFLAAVLFSYVAARVLEERLEDRMGRRARRQRDHVVVAGLGRTGFRVVRLLRDLEVPVVALEQNEQSPFRAAVAPTTPVLTGNARLAENLERAGIAQARTIVACTDDDLTNLAACLEARRVRPDIRTVARVGDDELADRLGPAFGLDLVASTTRVAASAFVAAATEATGRRAIRAPGLDLVGGRLRVETAIEAAQVEAWRGAGLRVLGRLDLEGRFSPPLQAIGRDLQPGDLLLVAAPAAVFDEAARVVASKPRAPAS